MSAPPAERSSCDRVTVDRASTEAALAADWSRANLAAYGAALRAEGDPRGELIELDLVIARDGSSPERVAHRTRLLADLGLARFAKSDFTYGFASELYLWEYVIEGPPTVLGVFAATPLATYVRGLRLWGSHTFLARELAELARGHHPWLRRLVLASDQSSSRSRPLIGKLLARRLHAAAPRLEVIDVIRFGSQPVVGVVPSPEVTVRTDPRPHGELVLEVPRQLARIELGRLVRLHDGIVDQLSLPAREAWAELRFAIAEHLPRGPMMLPATLLRAALVELDPQTYYVSDWLPLRDRLDGVDEVRATLA